MNDFKLAANPYNEGSQLKLKNSDSLHPHYTFVCRRRNINVLAATVELTKNLPSPNFTQVVDGIKRKAPLKPQTHLHLIPFTILNGKAAQVHAVCYLPTHPKHLDGSKQSIILVCHFLG